MTCHGTWLLGVDGEAAPVSDSVHALALAGLLLAMLAARDRVDRALPGFKPGQTGNVSMIREGLFTALLSTHWAPR